MCSQTYNDTVDFKSFGNSIINRCEINSTFFSKENKYPIYFYEMFLRVNDEILIPYVKEFILKIEDNTIYVKDVGGLI